MVIFVFSYYWDIKTAQRRKSIHEKNDLALVSFQNNFRNFLFSVWIAERKEKIISSILCQMMEFTAFAQFDM